MSRWEYVVSANGKQKAVTPLHWRAALVLRRCVAAGMREPTLTRRVRETGKR